jgi:hypothetical protein
MMRAQNAWMTLTCAAARTLAVGTHVLCAHCARAKSHVANTVSWLASRSRMRIDSHHIGAQPYS